MKLLQHFRAYEKHGTDATFNLEERMVN